MPVQEAIAASAAFPAAISAATSAATSAPAWALVNAQPALAGTKRAAADPQLTHQQPIKVARLRAEPQTAHLHNHAGVHHQAGHTNKNSPQGAEPTMEHQAARTLGHTEGLNCTAPAEQSLSEQVAVSSEQQAARLSSEVQAVPEVPFSVQSDINKTPIKPASSVPATSADASAVAAEAVAAAASAAAAAARQVVPSSEGLQKGPQAASAAESPQAASTTPVTSMNISTQQLQHRGEDTVEPPCPPESFSGTYIADLLAKRRQEVMAEAGVDRSSPANSTHNSA